MNDYRIPFALAVPVSIALLGALWILRKKSGSSGDKKKSVKIPNEKKESVPERSLNATSERKAQQIDKEGITITQRKIPETLARDRGSSDLNPRAPDPIAGSGDCHVPLKEKITSSDVSPITNLPTSDTSHGEFLTSTEKIQVELLLTSAMGDGLHEAQVKLAKPRLQTAKQRQTNNDILITQTNASSERSEGIKMCEEVVVNTKLSIEQISTLMSESFENGVDLKVPPSVLESTLEDKHITSSNDSSGVARNTGDLDPESCDKVVGTTTCATSIPDANVMDESHTSAVTEVTLSTESIAQVIVQSSLSAEVQSHVEHNLLEDSLSDKTSEVQMPVESARETIENEQIKVEQGKLNDVSNNEFDENPSSQETEHNNSQFNENNNSQLSDNNTTTTNNKSSLPCDRYGARSSSSPHTASNSQDSMFLNNESAEHIESNWAIASTLDEQMSEDAETSVSVSNFVLTSNEKTEVKFQTISPSETVEMFPTTTSTTIVDLDQNLSNAGNGKEESPTKSSSPLCDNNSEGSNDSGRGGSEHDVTCHVGDTLVHFDFNMPSDLCGRFIGKQGKNINYLKSKTGANVSLTNNPFTADYQICQVVGTQAEVDDALAMIRRKFPLNEFPLLTMVPINMSQLPEQIEQHPVIVPDVMQLSLPEGVSVEVYVSAIVDAGHVFVQQPTHRSFMSLEKLTYFLNTVYGQDPNVPCVPTPVECGIICVCENDGCWYRAMIMTPENEDGEAQVKFVDYGGYAVMPVTSLKQIRTDFMSLPFQAVECFMANITPNQGEQYFSEEATMTLGTMTEYKLLQCQVVARTENGIPYIHLYQVSPESNSAIMINRALVNNHLVRWIEIL
ncbi:unnamed protein product [Lymnaea stagnalis]|uniref:Tudor domain-containing protein n=1 Tax=Lymnaea stagnalis TaxID=6523 RepID=A0AAV2H4Z1_LYMST